MGLRGPKPKEKVRIEWSSDFAYAIGLLVTDGSVSKDGRHITFVSKDREQLLNIQKALAISVPLSDTVSGPTKLRDSRIQFSDTLFWGFLNHIGVIPNKTKIIGGIKIPEEYFMDFLRGLFDGDGSFYSYWDSRWKSSFMFYLSFVSASKKHIIWLQKKLKQKMNISGHITHGKGVSVYQLKYAKKESLKILKNMYYSDSVVCLSRKRKKIESALRTADDDR